MSTAEMKQKLHEKIDYMDEAALAQAEKFFDLLTVKTEQKDLQEIFDRAAKDYGNVLQKLAQ